MTGATSVVVTATRDTPLVGPGHGPPIIGYPWRTIARRFTRDRGAIVGLTVVLTIAALVVAAPLIAPYPPNTPLDIIGLRSQAPTLAHPFGTDPLSRDVLSRVLYGGRVSLAVAILAMLAAVFIGTLYGAFAGYVGGWVDETMMRVTDACLSIPRVLLLLTVGVLWGRLSFVALVLVLGLSGWFGVSRLVRADIMALRTREWALAAEALGCSRSRMLFRHLIPNAMSTVVVATALGIGNVILLEAGLSFLGIGIQPPNASWGTIIQDGADQVRALWWLSVFPGAAIVTTVLGINAIASGLQRVLNPRTSPLATNG